MASSTNRELGFEDFAHENGARFWYARDFMILLGYESFDSFKTVIKKAIAACQASEIPSNENFEWVTREVDGKPVKDAKLNRFACYLTAMNADSRKPTVAGAQAYFANLAIAVKQLSETSDGVERLMIRSEISDREISSSSAAKEAGVTLYALFKNAGYRGMYNMNLRELIDYKGADPKRVLFDFMGKEELAGNLFRITQTEARIRREGVRSQRRCEDVAVDVGKKVRNLMIENGGTPPEDLPVVEDIKRVKSKLRQAHKQLKNLDAPRDKSPNNL